MYRRLLAGFAGAVLIVSCTAVPAASPAPGTAAAQGPSCAKQGGTLVVALPGDIVRTDPALASETNSSYVLQNVLEGLMGFKPGTLKDPIPVLAAEAPTVSADGLKYTFQLRKNVKFHDGTPFDAAAVKTNFDRWTSVPKELQGIAQYPGIIFGFGDQSLIKSVDVIDQSTVAISLRRPNSAFLTYLTLPYFLMSSPAAMKAGGADNTVTDVSKITYAQGGPNAASGTGPFKFKEWVKGDHISIVKNADYWNARTSACLDQVVFRPIADQSTVLNGLGARDIDLAQQIAPTDIPAVQGKGMQILDRGESCNTFQVSINENFKPLDDVRVRQAIGYAVNKAQYVKTFYGGLGVPADNFMPLSIQYAKPLGLPTYDVAKAKALLASTGLSKQQLTLDFYYPSNVSRPYMPDPKGLFQAITADLEAAGFTINPHTDVWSPTYLDSGYAGKYPIWLLGITCQWAGADNFLKVNYFGYVNGKPPTNYNYKNDELEATMTKALSAPDAATAQQLWSAAQDMLARDLPIVPLVNSRPPGAAQAYVKGFVGAGNLQEFLNTVWLDK
jgi:peptide/nickel transport system substrate-binding protein